MSSMELIIIYENNLSLKLETRNFVKINFTFGSSRIFDIKF